MMSFTQRLSTSLNATTHKQVGVCDTPLWFTKKQKAHLAWLDFVLDFNLSPPMKSE
jgi:hypothetical protein